MILNHGLVDLNLDVNLGFVYLYPIRYCQAKYPNGSELEQDLTEQIMDCCSNNNNNNIAFFPKQVGVG